MATPRRRRVRDVTSQEDLINQLEQGEGVSKRSRQMLDDLKERDKAKASDVHDQPIFSTASEVDRILLDYLQPQPDNPRYLPVIIAKNTEPQTLADLTDCVVCEKGILENRLDKSNTRFSTVEKELDAIRELAETLKHNDLVHPITVWRANMSNYPIISGHRRYYAIRYLYGGMVKVKVKVYLKKPENVSVLRHIENFSRADLTPPDTLSSYINAVTELESILGSGALKSKRADTICSHLGISRAQHYRLDKLTEFREQTLPLLEKGVVTNISAFYAEINKAEESGGKAEVINYLKGIDSKGRFVKFMPVSKPQGRGRTKKFITMPKVDVGQTDAIKRLLTEDVTKLDIGIDWEDVDYNDATQLEKVLKQLMLTLAKK